MKSRIPIILVMCLFFVTLSLAQRYWVSVSGGAWSNAANWSATSGGAGGAGAPAATAAVFNGAGGAVGNCTIDAAVNVTSFSMGPAYTGSISQGTNTMIITGNSTWSGGTFLGGSSNIINTGSLTLSGTNFWSTSATLSVSNTYNFSSGTFTHNNGNVHFHSNSFAINGASNFYNLKFSSGSNVFTLVDPILALGNMTLDASDGSSMDLNIGAAAIFTVTGTTVLIGSGLIRCNTGTITALGDIDISNSSLSGGGTGTFKIEGTGNQLLSSVAAIKRGRLPKVIIAKPSGTLSLVGIITTIGPNWTYSTGTLDPGTSTVYFQRLAGGSDIVIAGTHTLNNAVFYPEYSITSITNSLTVNSLTIDGSQDQDVNINGSLVVTGTLSTTGASRLFINAGTINAKGDILVTNTSSFGGGTGTISIDGTGNQTFSNTGALTMGRLPSIIINKPSGTLSLSGNITTIGPNWSYISGSINPGSSTVYLYRNGTNITVAGTHTLNNLFIREPSFASTIINNNLAVNSVTIDGSTQHNLSILSSLTIDGNLTITGTNAVLLNTGTVSVKGNITNSNTHAGSGGTAVLIINGASNQSLTGTGLANQSKLPPNVILNKPSGQLIIAGGVPYYIYGSLNFTQGTVTTTSSQVLIFAAGSSVSGAPSNSAYVSGPVRKIGNTAFTFPVGKNGFYASVGISAPSNVTHAFTAEYFNADPHSSFSVLLKDVSLDHISRCEYWDLQRTTGASNVSVTVSWDTPRSCGVTNLTELRVAHWDLNLATPIWKDMGNSVVAGNTTAGTIRSGSVVSSFSPFSLASISSFNPLPIQLVSFTARCRDFEKILEWTTASEHNNNYFSIERSHDALKWDVLATVMGQGNSNRYKSYACTDRSESPKGLNYYRLKQTDFNNEETYSKIVVIDNCVEKTGKIVLYPNPSNGTFLLEGEDLVEDVRIYDMQGKLVYNGIKNERTLMIDISNLQNGIYSLTLNFTQQKKIVLLHE